MSTPFIPQTVNSLAYPPPSPYPPVVLPFVISSSYDIDTGIKNATLSIQRYNGGSPLGIYQGSDFYDGNSIRVGMWLSSTNCFTSPVGRYP
jgi:hypothetical protein